MIASTKKVSRAPDPRLPLNLGALQPLLSRIRVAYHPEQIWLFGSRARGDAGPQSDWDLFVVVPDTTSDDELDPLRAWELQLGSGVPADIVPCRASTFREFGGTVNTLSNEVLRDGVRLDAE